MKNYFLYIVCFLCFSQQFKAQEDGVFAFSLPVRNSLKFNKYALNPTFSFVREQNKYITFTNKKQWVQFDDAPETYLFSYSGRLKENIGVGVGVFQQNYGVLTGFGGVLNFAYNVVLNRESNLTFGLNLAYHQSRLNDGKIITNFNDPSLANIPSNSIASINPGINYGTTFFDFGVSINNAVSYHFNTSEIIENNPDQAIQAHIMYTGYMNTKGFFDNSKFSTLIRSEFKKDKTIFSGVAMLTVPRGIWGQVGYNSLYGASAGIGLNISAQIGIEYNYEQSIGELSQFGNSHEITLAYRFKSNNRFVYNGDDEEEVALLLNKKSKRVKVNKNRKTVTSQEREAIAKAKEEAKIKAQEKSQAKIEARAKLVAEAKARREAKIKTFEAKKAEKHQITDLVVSEEEQTKNSETRVKALEEERLKQETITKAKTEAAAKKAAQEEQARLKALEEERLKQEAITKAKAEAAAKKVAQEEQARLKGLEEEKLKQETIAKAKAEVAAKKAAQEEQARLKALEEERLKQEAIAKAKAEEVNNIIPDELKSEAKDELANSMNDLKRLVDESQIVQQTLLARLKENVTVRQQDLDDLKEDNDLNEKGITVAPRPFKSIKGENEALDNLKVELDNIIISQNNKISELESLYKKRLRKFRDKNDFDNKFFFNTIKTLKSDQSQTEALKNELISKLETIKVATDIERKRRIKRAAFDNIEDRFNKDKETLDKIKKFTDLSDVELTEDDFDFGEKQKNIQIVKNVKNVDSGYYLVLAVHSSIKKRNEFLTKVVASGDKNVNFFYDVTSNKYFIYQNKFRDIGQAQIALQSKSNKPYNSRMSMVKIEN